MSRQLFQYDPLFGYRFIPDLKTRVLHEGSGYLVRVNSTGFRCDHEFTPHRPAGVSRALLFGDSYTAGDGVSNRARFGDVLERLTPGLEVYNFGLPGSGTDQQFLIYRELGRPIDHDLVIIAVLVENIRRNVTRYRLIRSEDGSYRALAKPYYTLGRDGKLALCHVPVPRGTLSEQDLPESERRWLDTGGGQRQVRRLIGRLGPRVKAFAQRVTRYQPLRGYSDSEHPEWLLMRAILSSWIALSTAPVLVVPIPLYHYVEEMSDPRPYQARFAELARDTGARVHDPLPDLQRVPRSDRRALRFAGDPHPTVAAHEIIARSLQRCLSTYMGIPANA